MTTINPTPTEPMFPEIVGQESAKRRIAFYLKGHQGSGVCPHLMFVAPKGCGKTMLAKATGKMLKQKGFDNAKSFIELNCSTLKSVKQFFNQVVIPHINHKEVTVLFDEASELPKDLTMALLTILNPNSENRTTFSYEDYTVDFDFSRQTFMFATTEAQQIFHALMDRCERVDLEEYTYEQLGEIVRRVCKDIAIEDKLLPKIATVLRGNARSAQKMANNIRTYLAGEKRSDFTEKDWGHLKHALSIQPLGLSPIEVQLLNILTAKKDCSLTYLASKTGLTKSCLQRDFEMYLQKMNLMEITTSGRAITKTGHDYLKVLKGEAAASILVQGIPSLSSDE